MNWALGIAVAALLGAMLFLPVIGIEADRRRLDRAERRRQWPRR